MRGASFARIVAGAREMSGHATCEVMAVRVRRYMALAPTPTSKVDMSNHKTHDARTPDRLGMYGAAIATIGVVASGPVGIVSLAGAVWTAVRPGWELGRAGMVAFACWNVLALAMSMSAWIVFRMRLRGYVRVNSSHRELRTDSVPLP
jgi:hypothetical protein